MRKQKTQPVTVRLPVVVVNEIDLLATVHQTDRTTEILRACEIYAEQVKDIDSEEIRKYFDYRKEKEEIIEMIDKMANKIGTLEKEMQDLKGN